MPKARLIEVKADVGRFRCSREKLTLPDLPLYGLVVVLDADTLVVADLAELQVAALDATPVARRRRLARRRRGSDDAKAAHARRVRRAERAPVTGPARAIRRFRAVAGCEREDREDQCRPRGHATNTMSTVSAAATATLSGRL